MSNRAITKALENKLKAIAPALPIAYNNVNFATPNGPYQSAYVLFARPDTTGFGSGPYLQSGYMQVGLHYPTGGGAGEAQARGDLIRASFFRGLSLAADGITTVIEETPEVSGGAIEGDRFVVKVLIRFYAQIEGV